MRATTNYLRLAILTLLALAALVPATLSQGAHTNPAIIATIPVGDVPIAVGVNPTTDRVYTANVVDDTVSVIDGATNAVVATTANRSSTSAASLRATLDVVQLSLSLAHGATSDVTVTGQNFPPGQPGSANATGPVGEWNWAFNVGGDGTFIVVFQINSWGTIDVNITSPITLITSFEATEGSCD